MSWLARLREISQTREVPTPKSPITPVSGVLGVRPSSIPEEFAARIHAIDPGDAANINAWLDSIGEHELSERAAVLSRCAESTEACALVVGIAVGALLGWDTPDSEPPDALRTCRTCGELAPSGLCRAAMRGGIEGAAASWEPRAGLPRRCVAYAEKARSRVLHGQASERDRT